MLAMGCILVCFGFVQRYIIWCAFSCLPFSFLQTHLEAVWKTIALDGISVIGYTAWSYADNYEWGSYEPGSPGLGTNPLIPQIKSNWEATPPPSASIGDIGVLGQSGALSRTLKAARRILPRLPVPSITPPPAHRTVPRHLHRSALWLSGGPQARRSAHFGESGDQ